MGLDMYLYRKTYIGANEMRKYHKGWEDIKIEIPGVKGDRVSEVREDIMYWRKANAIHSWFVENCQNGVDECQETWVPKEKLEELWGLCENVLEHKDPDHADDVLPTASGFFFGGLEYDEYYFEDIQRTYDVLNEILSGDNCDSIYYQSSW